MGCWREEGPNCSSKLKPHYFIDEKNKTPTILSDLTKDSDLCTKRRNKNSILKCRHSSASFQCSYIIIYYFIRPTIVEYNPYYMRLLRHLV